MFLGVDLGTSSLKAILVDGAQRVVDGETVPLSISRPRPLWSEQAPEDWWAAALAALDALAMRRPAAMAEAVAIGLTGQMHGAVLVGGDGTSLRPAILWNDGRSRAECAELERREPGAPTITGNRVMPGFTAPKLLWLARHEPELFARVDKVLLPKDWLRLRLAGIAATDPSDASGTGWLDVAGRTWSGAMLAATGLAASQMPEIVEGPRATGTVLPHLARRWGMGARVLVAAGGGDNAAGAIGVGATTPGDAMLSLGTSGVLFTVTDGFRPAPERAVHAFCHALPGTWHQMAVTLSAAACLGWLQRLVGTPRAEGVSGATPVFLPYLSGERTPHDDPAASGVFFGLTHETTAADLEQAVLEGVAFALADGADAMAAAGSRMGRCLLIGGGAGHAGWPAILATVLGMPLDLPAGGEFGPAFGAARLARMAATGETAAMVCVPPAIAGRAVPDSDLAPVLDARRAIFRALYPRLQPLFPQWQAARHRPG